MAGENFLSSKLLSTCHLILSSFHFTLSLSFLVQPGCASAHIKFSRNLRPLGGALLQAKVNCFLCPAWDHFGMSYKVFCRLLSLVLGLEMPERG